jgi:hypothetical protein
MRYFIDTEFIDNGRTVDLISIGIVAEDGRELYIEVEDIDWAKADPWVIENVRAFMWSHEQPPEIFENWLLDKKHAGGLMAHEDIAGVIEDFCNPAKYGYPQFWAWYGSYDWFLMCQIFGGFLKVPDMWPNMTNDLKQTHVRLGQPPLPKQQGKKHNALEDARWNKRIAAHMAEQDGEWISEMMEIMRKTQSQPEE